jgi:hypothetical protein
VAFAADDAQLRAWSTQCATPFQRTGDWRWDQDGAAIAAAPDLLQGEFSRELKARAADCRAPVPVGGGSRRAAVALHIAATLAQWTWLRFDAWRTSRAIMAVAANAGAGEHPTRKPRPRPSRANSPMRVHRAALPAPTDALPLLARAAPALAALPAGTFKIATYTPATWTFDLAKLDAGALAELDRRLATAGLATLQAATNAGARLRVTLAPGMDLP